MRLTRQCLLKDSGDAPPQTTLIAGDSDQSGPKITNNFLFISLMGEIYINDNGVDIRV